MPADPPLTFRADQSQVPSKGHKPSASIGTSHYALCLDLPLQAPEPQFTATRFASLFTEIEFVLPTKLTPYRLVVNSNPDFVRARSRGATYRKLHASSWSTKRVRVALKVCLCIRLKEKAAKGRRRT